jgi:hypothetical protein
MISGRAKLSKQDRNFQKFKDTQESGTRLHGTEAAENFLGRLPANQKNQFGRRIRCLLVDPSTVSKSDGSIYGCDSSIKPYPFTSQTIKFGNRERNVQGGFYHQEDTICTPKSWSH